MGNIPIPFTHLRINSWTTEKKLLIWKTVSMAACIIGSVIYLQPLEPYFEMPFFGILVPTFITGYIVIHSSDIYFLVMGEEYIFLETCFSVIGAVGNLVCSGYQFYKWITWLEDTREDPNADDDTPEVMLAFALLLHSVSLIAVMIHRFLHWRQSLNTGSGH
ncbi:smooth septate junction protein snakeskin isoform X2 [Megachile rotundata]|uniref:smooth septate junction protein snakeskin isoform X2 n=1 Tax=Megachile rotundata TaxID=143995 RepID=UPI003FD332FC